MNPLPRLLNKFSLLFLLASIVIKPLTSVGQCDPVGDSLALVALYNATNGPNWTNKTNWLVPGKAIGTWFGVYTETQGCVYEIRLRSNKLNGNIPVEIGQLSSLARLDLSINQLSGSLPTEIGNLPGLLVLTLNDNKLTGNIPFQLASLNSLTALYLSNNQLSGNIPPELGSLEALLDFNNNQLSGNIPPELGFFQKTRNFANNNLSGCFPAELCSYFFLHNFSNNPKLPWQGNLTNLCIDNNPQTGAICDDGNPLTYNDIIQTDCSCAGAPTSCTQSDSLALVALYNATNGPNWTNKTNWLVPGMPIGTWYGVTVNGQGCVTCLDLDGTNDCIDSYWTGWGGNNLSGSIPPELGNLNMLEGLFLTDNNLIDTIPKELGSLSSLRGMYFYHNDLSGNIPEELGNLNNLESLILSFNNLSGAIPATLGNLDSLRGLDLSFNNLSDAIPTELGELYELKGLILSANSLSNNIPSQFGNLHNLVYLDISGNNLSGNIPSDLGNLDSLQGLILSFNGLEGSIPEELGNLNNLLELRLSGNNLTGNIPIELGNLSKLNWLSLNNNNLSGNIPYQLGNLDSLASMLLFDNNLNGTIPSALGNLSNLFELNLSFNNLDGCYPNELLVHCTIDYDYSGNPALPWQGDFTRFCNGEAQIGAPCDDGNPLTSNDIIQPNCSCAGTPPSCTQSDSLALVALYNATNGPNWTNNTNWLVPGMPIGTWFGVTVNGAGCVTSIRLSNNQLSGNLPPELGNLTSLLNLYLGTNQLMGNIPLELGNLTNLKVLYLVGNQLSGNIPVTLGNLTNLDSLHLGLNYISGNIPSELGNLENLIELILGYNQLNGTIPLEMGNLSNLKYLDIFANQLSGNIPPELGNLANLEALWLGYNQLSGNIPPELGNLTNLHYLALNYNLLNGNIPVELGNLENLDIIWLENNQLNGNIPWQLSNLTALTQFFLKNNQLSGCFPPELNLHCSINYDLSNNPALPWQGDFSRFCNGESQTGAPCDDGNANTTNDVIDTNCTCAGTPTTCTHPDKPALIALYEATGGDNWTNTWDTTTCNVCDWVGLGCDGNGRVTTLNLGNNNLSGVIPTAIGNLTNLQYLNLFNNQLTGTIPVELSGLAALEELYLSLNQLIDPIPPELGDLTNLRVLDLSSLQLSGGIPTSLGTLPNLERLYLFFNQLTGTIPGELGNLTNLTEINLSSNQLSGCFPAALSTLCNINYVFAGNPGLPDGGDFDSFCLDGTGACTTTPPCPTDSLALVALYNATHQNGPWTQEWNLSTPMSTWYGVSVSQTGCVDTLHLGQNNLSGILPDELGNLTEIKLLNLSTNNISGNIPATLGQLDNLLSLNLSQNSISGSIPSSLGQLGSITGLYLNENQLSGTIPASLTQLTSLEYLNLSVNQLSGAIPPNISSLAQLTHCFLNNNQFTGSIPTGLGQLTQLVNLNLSNNQLSGGIPAVLSNLPTLDSLYLNNNQLSGCIPAALQALCPLLSGASIAVNPNLNTQSWGDFCSSQTGICGSCVQSDSLALVALYNATNGQNWTNKTNWLVQGQPIGTWYGVTVNGEGCVQGINLDSNMLVGTIPSGLEVLQSLQYLWLNLNQLSGFVPPELGNLSNLQELWLLDNQLTGSIPTELSNLQNLRELNLSINDLSGTIPAEFENLQNLEGLWLYNNQLSGIVPPELGNLSNLQELWLLDNQLTGSIPTELSNLQNLRELNLSINDLSGTIPAEFENLQNLEGLWLYVNQLNGSIPAGIGNIPSLKELWLSANQLSGFVPSELGNLTNLEELNLSFNQLTDSLPYQIGNLPELQLLRLNNNQLSGNIPFQLAGLTNLQNLYLNNNQLSGCFPPQLLGLCPVLNKDFTNNPNLPGGGDFDAFCAGQNPAIITSLDTTLCEGESLSIGGNTYTQTGSYSATLSAFGGGCDSIVNLTLSYYPSTPGSISQALCPGESLSIGNTTFNQANPTGQVVLDNAAFNGCDSLVNVNLSFYPPATNNLTQTLCTGGSLTVNGTVYNETNPTGTEVLSGAGTHGCDSTVFVSLSFNSIVTFDLAQTLCFGESITVNGTVYDQANPSGSESFPNGSLLGCDSVVNINLSFYPIAQSNYSPTLCPGESVIVNGTEYNEANPTGTETLMNASVHGCDSTVNINLSFYPPAQFNLSQTLCPGESITINGTEYNELNPNGSEVLIGVGTNGCDSTVNINLSFYTPAQTDLTQALCPGESITINGIEYNELNPNGSEVLIGAGTNGCDSTVNVQLSFLSPSEEVLDSVICEGESVFFNGQSLNVGGEYEQVVTSVAGCDSIVTVLQLTVVNPPSPFAENDEATIGATETTASIDVLENDMLSGVPLEEWEVTIFATPNLGSVMPDGDDRLRFELSDPSYHGQDSFSYVVCHEVCPLVCDTATVLIFIEEDCFQENYGKVPNVFTPNGDDVNAFFDPLEVFKTLNCVPTGATGELTIVNRWGEMLFRAAPYVPWDGLSAGGTLLPQGAYYYLLKVETREKTFEVKGAINLILQD